MISESENLRRREANYRPLTPMHFLLRSADVFPERVAVIDGARSFTWRQYADRCLRLASALRKRGIGKGDIVAVLAPNTSAMLEAHFGIPMAGAVICALNVRLDASTLAFILGHSEAKILLANRQFADLARQAVAMTKISLEVIGIDDPEAPEGEIADWTEYESLLKTGDAADGIVWPDDEWDSIALNYTSGTTGNPKGAVYHHRGTYLNSLGQLLTFGIGSAPVYLWTLPMFHCNGWCFAWAIAAAGGTHVCLRRAAADTIFDAISRHDVTHMCCAPTVLNFVVEGAEASGARLPRPVEVMTAGAAPPAAVLRATEALGFRIRHVYGMVEMHGVIASCDWHPEWDDLPAEERAGIRARQDVRTVVRRYEGSRRQNLHAGARRRADDGRSHDARQRHDEGIFQESLGYRRGTCRRLVPQRRSRDRASGRLYRASRQVQRHHHLRRRKHLVDRDRGCALFAPRGVLRGGNCHRAPTLGRGTLCIRRAEAILRRPRHGG